MINGRVSGCLTADHSHLTGNVGFNPKLFCFESRVLLVDCAAK